MSIPAPISLPFRVQPIDPADIDSLSRLARFRSTIYGQRNEAMRSLLSTPDSSDFSGMGKSYVAISKLDDAWLGSLRIDIGGPGHPLPLEAGCPALPSPLLSEARVEGLRFCLSGPDQGPGLIKAALLKACTLDAIQEGARFALAAAKSPLDRLYERLLFTEVFPSRSFDMPHAPGYPHRIFFLDLLRMPSLWREAGHPLYSFFFEQSHADIQLAPPRWGLSSGLTLPTFNCIPHFPLPAASHSQSMTLHQGAPSSPH